MGKARRRRNATTSSSSSSSNNKSTKQEASEVKSHEKIDDDETLFQTFHRHPLIRAAITVGIPYAVYMSWQIVPLQHPSWVSKITLGAVKLRPVVPIQQERQLLIVGSMSSGTTSMADGFQKKLGLEVGHESSNTMYDFVRDGTVSWFHGVRFFDVEQKEQMVKSLCSDPLYNNMGFHPKMFQPSKVQCSPPMLHKEVWNECWMRECRTLLNSEVGCSLVRDTSESISFSNQNTTCLTPFQTTLHQVRNPLRTIESLVVKYCIGGISGNVQPAFLKFTSSLFPDISHSFSHDSCVEIAAEYLVRYSQELVRARVDDGVIDDFFRIEESSICDVAKMGGFLDIDTASYPPTYAKVQNVCSQKDVKEDMKSKDSHEERSSTKIENKRNRVNKGRVKLGWKNLHGGLYGSVRKTGDDTLEKQVRQLFRDLGYDENLESDYIENPETRE